ncbi:hypothetical protein NLJ89_g3449 [Agrocybe chaxingu]|uniref:Chitin-binding type-4 domain-containing protein n=1 Tax=Agrocybe chaxingu TaxID=84603 RepID=A0A9W8K592_9AGAR|nr:hypothetical protein NLJ89_g3449 [Agrocybe chaxingu]
MKNFAVLSLVISTVFFGSTSGHAIVTTPTPRKLGPAASAACGAAVYKVLNSDKTGPFEDNASNVKTFTPGQSIHFLVDIVAHHTGRANVSVVDLKTQKTIGTPLFNWPVYADNNLGPADWVKNETDFTVVLPDLGTHCQQAGTCAIQWWWYATSNKQTYQSCVDFVTP